MADPKRFVLKLAETCQCDPCMKKLEKVKGIYGVHSTSFDADTRELTIWGTVDPQKVIGYLGKHRKEATLVLVESLQARNNNNVPITNNYNAPVQVNNYNAPVQVNNYNEPVRVNNYNARGQIPMLPANLPWPVEPYFGGGYGTGTSSGCGYGTGGR